uniref:EF-hand domain-containing protein n=1 Tax=Guillardia theta TaxID=55529 RepID=A0A7S4K8J1_GUITH|mmetsp:Transcript_21744/g.71925  ORF Transcript_21744/g.71925 Transcript_21744/m.71925 type:complete len:802 (+) Transcript_21744:134-2539(+)
MKVSRLKHLLKHRIPNPQLSDKRQLEEDEARGSASSQESPTYTSQRFLGDDLYSHHDAMEVVEQHGQDVGDVKLNKPTKKKLLTKLRIPQLKEHSNKLQDSDAVASFLHTDRPSQPELYREARYRRLVVRTRSDSLSSDVEELEKKEKFEAVRARREAEKQLVILRDKLSKEQSKNKVLQEKVWSLEECLSTKDADLEVKDAECEHLRFLISRKSASETYMYQKVMQQHEHPKADRESTKQVGEDGLSGIGNSLDGMEEFLNELEVHLHAGKHEETDAALLLQKLNDERARRIQDKRKKAVTLELGADESLHKVCECGRVTVRAEKAVECHLSYMGGAERAEEETKAGATSSKKDVKKARRIPMGVPSPFDAIVKNTERWFKEKSTRIAVLTDKKILQTVTSILLEKISADMVDDFWNREREKMEIFMQEYFLSLYGIRTLADFYLLELLQGIKMFINSHKRISQFARFAGLRFTDEEPQGRRHLDFYLETCKELLAISRDAARVSKRLKAKPPPHKPEHMSTAKLSHEVKVVQDAVAVLAQKSKSDEQVLVKRLSVWRAIRRVMEKMMEHKWLPREYPTVEELRRDERGIAQEEVDFDDAMELALQEYDMLLEARREQLVKLFYIADADKSGRVDFVEFKALLDKLDPQSRTSNVKGLHLFREIIRDEDDDTVDVQVFCTVMQGANLDRPRYLDRVMGEGSYEEEDLLLTFNAHLKPGKDTLEVDQLFQILNEMQISSLRANDTIKKLNKEDVKHLDFKTFLRIIRKLQLGGSSAPRVSFQEPDDQEAPAQDDGVWDEFV